MDMIDKRKTEYVRNFIFGVEDSLVSTVGLVSGVAVAGVSNKNVVLTGTVLVFVEAFSMAVGSLLSENSADEYESKSEVALSGAVGYSLVMFTSYLISGVLVVLPYACLPPQAALWTSIAISITGLFFLGMWSGRVARVHWLKRAITMALIGGLTIVLGIAVGQLVDGVK